MNNYKETIYKTTLNVLTDGESWTEDSHAIFKKLEMVEGSDAFDSLKSGYIPDPCEDGLIRYIDIRISLDFVKQVYELAFGENAIEIIERINEKDVLVQLKKQLELGEFAIELLDRRQLNELACEFEEEIQ